MESIKDGAALKLTLELSALTILLQESTVLILPFIITTISTHTMATVMKQLLKTVAILSSWHLQQIKFSWWKE